MSLFQISMMHFYQSVMVKSFAHLQTLECMLIMHGDNLNIYVLEATYTFTNVTM